MKERRHLLRQKIIDFQNEGPPGAEPRSLSLPRDPRQIVAVYGMRRSGKTFILHRTIRELEVSGIKRSQILWLSFDDERLEPYERSLLSEAFETQSTLFPEWLEGKRYLFFDEVQEVDGWEAVLRRFYEDQQNRIYITGSSARLLSHEIHSKLRGRALGQRVFPLSFREMLAWNKLNPAFLGTKEEAHINHAFELYLGYGGFPGLFEAQEKDKHSLLKSYVETCLLRDIIERYHVSRPAVIRFITLTLLRNMSSLISVNRLHKYLRSGGFKIGIGTVHKYVSYFEDACLFYPVKIFAESVRKQASNPFKVYLADHALTRNFSPAFAENRGHSLENIVALELLRRDATQVSYYRTRSGLELDFVAVPISGRVEVIQVCESLENEAVCARELRAMREALEELGVKEGLIVVRHGAAKEVKVAPGFKVHLCPIIRWLVSSGE